MHDFRAQKIRRGYLLLLERLCISLNKVDNQSLNLLLFAVRLRWLHIFLTKKCNTILFYNIIKRRRSFN